MSVLVEHVLTWQKGTAIVQPTFAIPILRCMVGVEKHTDIAWVVMNA